MKFKRKFLLFLTIFLFINTVVVNAEPVTESYRQKENIKMSITSKIQETALTMPMSSGDTGALYASKMMLTLLLYTDTVLNDSELNFTTSEKNSSVEVVNGKVSEFNEVYKDIEGLSQLDRIEVNNSKYNENGKKIVDYCNHLLSKIQNAVMAGQGNNADELSEEQTAIFMEHRETACYIYEVIRSISDDIVTLRGYRDDTTIYAGSPYSEFTNLTITYRLILLKAKEQSIKLAAEGDGTVLYGSEEADVLERLTDVSKGEVSNAYLKMFACSSVYVPFSSKVGDNDFLTALETLASDDADTVLELYKQAMNYRKPLYKANKFDKFLFSNSKTSYNMYNPTSASKVTVGELISAAQGDKALSLVTMYGKLELTEDGNSYAYYIGNKGTNLDEKDKSKDNQENKDNKDSDDKDSDSSKVTSANDSVYLEDTMEITNSSDMTPSLFFAVNSHSLNNTNYAPYRNIATLKNMIADQKGVAEDSDLSSQFLYINFFGDIVSSDNTVIIPGMANSNYFTKMMGTELESEESKKLKITEIEKNSEYLAEPYWYIFTAAFMNSYPKFDIYSSTLKIPASRDEDKALIRDYNGGKDGYGYGKENYLSDCSIRFVDSKDKLQYKDRDVGAIWYKMKPSFNGLGNTVGTKKFDNFSEGAKQAFAAKPYLMYVYGMKVNGCTMFPYTPDIENYSTEDVVSAIAGNAYWYLTRDKDDNITNESNGTLNTAFLSRIVATQARNGLLRIEAYEKNTYTDLDAISDSQTNLFTKIVRNICGAVLNQTSSISGVLGFKDSFQDPLMSKFTKYGNKFLYFILVIFFIIVIISYMRNGSNFFAMMTQTAIICAFFYAAITIIPSYLPKVYNFVLRDSVDNLSHKNTLLSFEDYGSTYKDKSTINSDGGLVSNSGSINAYKLTTEQQEEMAANLNMTKDELLSGKAYLLDENSGMFVEGDTIKFDLDKLVNTLSIYGTYEDVNGEKAYRLKSEKMVSSNIDYYMPYYQIVDNLTYKLNVFANIYSLSPYQLNYEQGFSKDSFLVTSFVNSRVFMEPSKYWIGEEGDDTPPEVMQELKSAFGENNPDFLGLYDVITKPTSMTKSTLWYNNLEKLGYLKDEEKLNKLVETVNYQTKKFILDFYEEWGYVSDENAIKMISLYAVETFNQKVSDFYNYMYPISLNYEETTLNEAIIGLMSNQYEKYTSSKMDTYYKFAIKHGTVPLIIITIYSAFAFGTFSLSQFFISFVYIVMVFLVGIRFIRKDLNYKLFRGMLKVILLTLAVYILSNWTLIIYGKFKLTTTPALWGLAAIQAILLFILATTVWDTITGIYDLGDGNFMQSMSNVYHKTLGKALGRMSDKIGQGFSGFSHRSKVGTLSTQESYATSDRYQGRYSIDRDIDKLDFEYNDSEFLDYNSRTGNKHKDFDDF